MAESTPEDIEPEPAALAPEPEAHERGSRAAIVAMALTVALTVAVVAVLVHRAAELVPGEPGATASVSPDDPGDGAERSGWRRLQWNFVGPFGVEAPRAWDHVAAAGAPGGSGVIVAVLDTGVAYPGNPRSRPASPDLSVEQFVPGYDFVDDDDDPYDSHGHGTHVASTIAEHTDNGYGLTGLAYGVRLMPVRVLDRGGDGDATTIANGIRYATEHGAKIINLSLNYGPRVTERQAPEVLDAIREATAHGTLVVAGAGNDSRRRTAFPARAPGVVAVGATTEHGCLASYSNYGPRVDLVAPGGGRDANVASDRNCRPGRAGAPIFQMTRGGRRRPAFRIEGLTGTSMAAPHVSAVAALVVASGVIGEDPTPATLAEHLRKTARDLGAPGCDARYGCGLLDAAAATTPTRRTG